MDLLLELVVPIGVFAVSYGLAKQAAGRLDVEVALDDCRGCRGRCE